MKKEERKAYDKAIKQYTAELNKINPIEVIKRVDTNSKRKVEEDLGDAASGRLTSLTKKADKIARTINNDGDYSKSVGQFNERYDILKKQMAGGYTTRYGVKDAPVIKADPKVPSIMGLNREAAKPMGGNSNQGMMGFVGSTLGDSFKKPVAFESTFATQDEALKAAQQKADQYNANLTPVVSKSITGQSVSRMPASVTANDFMENVEYKGGASGRTEKMGALSGGYEDMARLSKTVQDSAGNANVGAYASLAEKLKQQYKRDAGAVAVKPTGLLSSELAGNPLANEGIIG